MPACSSHLAFRFKLVCEPLPCRFSLRSHEKLGSLLAQGQPARVYLTWIEQNIFGRREAIYFDLGQHAVSATLLLSSRALARNFPLHVSYDSVVICYNKCNGSIQVTISSWCGNPIQFECSCAAAWTFGNIVLDNFCPPTRWGFGWTPWKRHYQMNPRLYRYSWNY